MATRIVAVQTKYAAQQPGTLRHRHITHVKTLKGRVLTRERVAAKIRSGAEEFYTLARGIVADVTVMRCPHCGRRDYIRTRPDQTKKNNLLSLPPISS